MIDAVIFTSVLICLLSLIFLFTTKNKFLGYNIFYIFSLIFFGIAPAIQYKAEVSFFNARPLTSEEYLHLNTIIIAILLVYHLVYLFFPIKAYLSFQEKQPSLYVKKEYWILGVAFVLFGIKASFFIPNNILGLFLRSENHVEYNLDPSLTTLITSVLTLLPGVMLLHLVFLWKKKLSLIRIIILLILVASSFPLAISRTLIAVIYLPLIFILIPILFKKNYFNYFVIGSVFFVFPFLNQFRDIRKFSEISLSSGLGMLKTAHFDSYYNFALIINTMPIQYGKQLLGVLGFFIPRSIWPEKPVGSGALLAENLQMNFTNISANFFAEGYINFGYIGVFIFAILLGLFTKYFDFSFLKQENQTNPRFVTYLQVVILLFYLLRGDLMSAFSLLISILLYNFIVIKLLYEKKTF